MVKDKVVRLPPSLSDRARQKIVDRLVEHRRDRLMNTVSRRRVTLHIPASVADDIAEIFTLDGQASPA